MLPMFVPAGGGHGEYRCGLRTAAMEEPAALVTDSDVRLLVDEVLEDPVIFNDRREAPILEEDEEVLLQGVGVLDPELEYRQELRYNQGLVSEPLSQQHYANQFTSGEYVQDLQYDYDSGQEVQRISVINNLPDLLRDHHDDCMRRVVPKVREVLHVAQAEMQLAACTAFLQILQKQLVPLHNYTQTFLQTILMAIDSRDPDVASAWLETLLDVIDLLPKDIIRRDILGIAVMKGQLSQTVQSRLSCCQILGKIATKFDPFIIKKDILPVVQSLCQDVDYEVRGCMCRQLDPVARGLGLEATKNVILPELVELTKDEESFVRLAGLETVVEILSLLDDETCVNTIIPLVCNFCQQSMAADDPTLPTVSRQLGRLLHGLGDNLTEEQKHWFVDFYRKLCRIGLSKMNKQEVEHIPPVKTQSLIFLGGEPEEEEPSVECRRYAAFNFPAMLKIAGVRNFKAELSSSFSYLCSDPHFVVRQSAAAGFHEVAKMLGNNVHLIQADLIDLIKDDNTNVLKSLLANLPGTLEILAMGGDGPITEAKMMALSNLIPAILDSEVIIFASNDWRLQVTLMENLSSLPLCFTSDQIYFKFVPMLLQKLQTARAKPVRLAAVSTLLCLLRATRKLEQRDEICRFLCTEFANSSSCYHRSLFIDMCWSCMQLFSRSFFKDYFFEAVLELALDPVPNIRLRVCPLLPHLKAHIKLPSDRNFLQMLEATVRKLLLNEEDMDVHEALQIAIFELDTIQVQMESLKLPSHLTKKPFLEEDIFDLKKEEEEDKMLENEERDRQAEEIRLVKKERTKDSSKKEGSKIPAPRKGTKIPAATCSGSKDKLPSSPNHSNTVLSGKNGLTRTSSPKDMKRTPSFSKSLEKGVMASTSSSRIRAAANAGRRDSTGSPWLSHRPPSLTSTTSWKKVSTGPAASGFNSSITSGASGCAIGSGSGSSSGGSVGVVSPSTAALGSTSGSRRASTGSGKHRKLKESELTAITSRRHTLGPATGIPTPTIRKKTQPKS